jgi:hypothetical protein
MPGQADAEERDERRAYDITDYTRLCEARAEPNGTV